MRRNIIWYIIDYDDLTQILERVPIIVLTVLIVVVMIWTAGAI